MSKHLSELFTVRNGVPATSLNISDIPVEGIFHSSALVKPQ
jgi:hypothetical protein